LKRTLLIFLQLFFWSCQIVLPELEWEDLESDHDPVLNIVGVLSTDSLGINFVRVHRTLRLDEASDTLIRQNIDGELYISYGSRFLVRDAEVIVSNGTKDYEFEFAKWAYEDGGQYVYNGDDLSPKPNETWTLSVNTPSGLSAKGTTLIPPSPIIDKTLMPDSFDVSQSINILWAKQEDHYQIINTNNLLSYYLPEQNDENNESRLYSECGFWQQELIEPGDTKWIYRKEYCGNIINPELGETIEDYLMIKLMSMDSNYYNYFIKFGSDAEFASLFLGQGGSGQSIGIEEGIGVFGSIGVDRHWIPIKR
jgi:hypothetical protein